MKKSNPYKIQQVLNVKINVESDQDSRAEDIRDRLCELTDWTDRPEAFFSSISIWEMLDDPGTSRPKSRHRSIHGQWYVSKYEEIAALVDGISIGKPPVTLEEALEDVNAEVNQYQIEARRQAEVVARYDETVDNYECLTEEYYYNGFKLMRAQSDLDRNNILEDIRDELKTISGALKDIGKELSER